MPSLRSLFLAPAFALAATASLHAQTPTLADVPYGAHPQQKLDFYQTPGEKPAPLLFFTHGGGCSPS